MAIFSSQSASTASIFFAHSPSKRTFSIRYALSRLTFSSCCRTCSSETRKAFSAFFVSPIARSDAAASMYEPRAESWRVDTVRERIVSRKEPTPCW